MPIKIDQWTAVEVEDGGKYGWQIVEGRYDQEGNFKPNWCRREYGKKDEKVEKNLPVKIKLGDKDSAIQALLYALQEITGQEYAPV